MQSEKREDQTRDQLKFERSTKLNDSCTGFDLGHLRKSVEGTKKKDTKLSQF